MSKLNHRKNFQLSYILVLVVLILTNTSLYFESGPISAPDNIINPKDRDLKTIHADDDSSVILTWTSRKNLEPTRVSSEDCLMGDHVILTAVFSEIQGHAVESCSMHVRGGVEYHSVREEVVPSSDFNFLTTPIVGNESQFDWTIVKGFSFGDHISIEAEFNMSDCDFLAWAGDINPQDYRYDNNILNTRMMTTAMPETCAIDWASENDTLVLACYNYDRQPGEYRLRVESLVEVIDSGSGNLVSVDTYSLGLNKTVDIHLSAYSEMEEKATVSIPNVEICNFFVPIIREINIEGDSTKQITWITEDTNILEQHSYEIRYSNDGGESFQLIQSQIEDNEFLWNTTGFIQRDDYIIRVIAIDDSGLIGAADSQPFQAGTIQTSRSGILDPPEISGPNNLLFTQGSMEGYIHWVLEYSDVLYYTIEHNGQQIQSGNWTSGIISVKLAGLTKGHHVYSLIVNDIWGASKSHSVSVDIVSTNIIPSVNLHTAIPVLCITIAVVAIVIEKLLSTNMEIEDEFVE